MTPDGLTNYDLAALHAEQRRLDRERRDDAALERIRQRIWAETEPMARPWWRRWVR